MAVQIVRDWVVRFNTEGRDVPLNRKMVGARSILDDSQRQGLRRMVEDDPIPAVHGVVRWRLIDLAWPIFKSMLSRELRNMGTRQALGKAAPSRARRGSRCGFQKRMARFQRQSRANAVKKLRRMSTRPSRRSLPSSQATASAKARCISNPMIRRPFPLTGSSIRRELAAEATERFRQAKPGGICGGRNTTSTDPRSQRIREGREGRPWNELGALSPFLSTACPASWSRRRASRWPHHNAVH